MVVEKRVFVLNGLIISDDSQVAGTEGDPKETFLYSVTSEVLYSNSKVPRYLCRHLYRSRESAFANK